MADFDVISLSSDSSRPSSPFINVSEVFNDSEKCNKTPSIIEFGEIEILSPKKTSSPRIAHTLSESDVSENEINVPCTSDLSNRELNRLFDKYSERCYNRPNTARESSDTDELDLIAPSRAELKRKNEQPKKWNNGSNTRMTKAQKMEEKLLKQREKEQKRAEKLAAKEMQNYLKPGNCLKYMTVMMDSSLAMCPFGGILIAAVQNAESKCHMSSHSVPQTIFWKRELPRMELREEEFLILIWDWQTVIPAMKNQTLCSQIQEVQAQYPGKIVHLVLYGLNSYFSYLKSKRKNNSNDFSKRKKKEKDGLDIPHMTRKEIEEELIELQISTNCNYRLIESPEDLGQLIIQITKAVAETPFKLDKQRRELENLEWFAVGDSRDCVTVDKAGNGLLRLWQQQLCQFNLAGHDVAQAIASVYPSPWALVQAYERCSSHKEAEDLLKDIQVRRCQGPISSSRRIGPELSKKISTFFRSTNGDISLS